jgi:KDO2-lipid IV(A) lauroyltransferase
MRERVEYILVKLFLWFAKIAPKSFIYTFFKTVAQLLYKLDNKRCTLTIRNLSNAYPKKSIDEIKVLSKEVYTELSKTVSEILLMFVDRFDIDRSIKNFKEVKEKLEYISRNTPQGVIVITAHFSNWELAAHFLAKHGLPMLAIGREGNNKLIDQNLTIPFRNKYGNKATSKDNAMLAMAKVLKQGNTVGLLIDQKSGHLNSIKVDFFGQPAETTLSVAMLKLKFNPLIVPIFIARQSDGMYELIINDPIDYVADEVEDKEKKLELMTVKYNLAIEEMIRKYPAQWFWMHNRWRL